jgi:Flavin containing amine oxidoreductase/Sodium:sulfate symporter transmembrane region
MDSGTVEYLSIVRCGLQPRATTPRRVVVVGAGIAGLVAAHELLRAGHDPFILEARGRVGGRVYTLRESFASGLHAEAGAMRIPRAHDLSLAYVERIHLVLGFGLLGGGLGALPSAPPASVREHALGRWHRPGGRGAVALVVAGVLLAAAVLVQGRSPQAVFLLQLGAAVALWMSEVVPDAAVSLGLVAAWVLFGLAPPAQAAFGFASMDWVFVLAVLGIAAAITRSGLVFRAGLLLIPRLPASLLGQAGTLLLTGIILSALLPSAMGRVALSMPLALAIADAHRLQERQPTAAVLGLAAWIGAGGPLMFVFVNAAPLCLLMWGLLPDATRLHFDWLQWAIAAGPLCILVSTGMLLLLFPLLHPTPASALSRQRVQVQLAVLGPPRGREVAMLIVLLLTVTG